MDIAGRLEVKTFYKTHRVTLARLENVNRSIARLETWEAAPAGSESTCRQVEPPVLSGDALGSLRNMLEEALAEMKQVWKGGTNGTTEHSSMRFDRV